MTTLTDGRFGTRGLSERSGSPSWPSTLAAGVYDSDTDPSLLQGPIWTSLDLEPDDGWVESIELDLRRGAVTTTMEHPRTGDIVTVDRFASIVRPGVCALRITGPARAVLPSAPFVRPSTPPGATVDTNDAATAMVVRGPVGTIAGVAHTDSVDRGPDPTDRRVITRIVALGARTSTAEVDMRGLAVQAQGAYSVGFDALEEEHRRRWGRRWQAVGTRIEGDTGLDVAVRFATSALLGAGAPERELAIGARGLTGFGYRGHVFWDTDVFVTPALCGLEPRAARATLGYRWARLGAARVRASSEGFDGARFPWESARTGGEVTPSEARDLHGATIPILTGELEEHIVADVAWSVMHYFRWTDDREFMRSMGNELLLETARYWASRIELDSDGSGHIRNVIGPDEYHEGIDDDAFTNAMARRNLCAGATTCRAAGTIDHAEYRCWMHLAEVLVDGFDPDIGTYEQFAGYHDLEPLNVADLGSPPIAADAILGQERTQRTQIIKQPDVLMMYLLIGDDLVPGTLDAALDHYLPRTAHGSSLSPATCAALLARAGRTDEAVHWFRWAARLDLDDLTGTTAGGLHLATMGGLWQAMTWGFLGIGEHRGGLTIDPLVPEPWGPIEHRFRFCGANVSVRVDGDEARVDSSKAIDVRAADGARHRNHHAFRRTPQGWEQR